MRSPKSDMLGLAPMPWDELEPSKRSTPRLDDSEGPGRERDTGELPRVGQVVDEKYRLDDWIGEGGMGVVFRATDLRLKRQVAVKLLHPRVANDPRRARLFLREAESMARLRHPNVVEIYDVGRQGTCPFLVMPYLRGADLADWAEQHEGPPLASDVVVGVLGQVCSGLEALHREGLVHGDIKPGNVLVSDAFEVVVTDFGLARRAEEDDSAMVTPGTPGFVAPELIAREAVDPELAHKADVYALGVTAYWLLTGHMPVAEDELFALLAKQLEGEIPPPSSVRPELPSVFDDPVLRALARSPRARPSASELREALFEARDKSHRLGAGGRPFVMLVDDDRLVLQALERVVCSALPDPEVIALHDPEAALSIVESRPPSLVITDLQMPRINGVEFVAALRGVAATRDVPIVVLSGVGGAEDWKLLSQLGVHRFLVKPVATDVLRHVIRQALLTEPEG